MARFRKGTTDHDNDGAMGGSLKAGTRFVRGTNDPDNDGNRGGSLPKGDEAMVKVKGATPSEKKTLAAAKKAFRGRVQAPRRTTRSDETPEAQPTKAKKQAAAEGQFAKADAAAASPDNAPDDMKLRMAALGGL